MLLIFFIIGFKSNDWPIVIQLIPIYSSLLFLGLSHGAADHLCMWGFLKKQSIKNKDLKFRNINSHIFKTVLT